MTNPNQKKQDAHKDDLNPLTAAVTGAVVGAGVVAGAVGVMAMQDEKNRAAIKQGLSNVKNTIEDNVEAVQEKVEDQKKQVEEKIEEFTR